MKKVLLVFTLLMVSIVSFAQTQTKSKSKKVELAQGKVVDWEIITSIKDDTDSTTFFFWGYQNVEYQYLTDIGSVFFMSKSDLEEFVKTIESLVQEPLGSEVEYTVGGKFKLSIYNFSEKIYVTDDEGKYTVITKKTATKMVEEIKPFIHLLK